jgi:hypothetical protein
VKVAIRTLLVLVALLPAAACEHVGKCPEGFTAKVSQSSNLQMPASSVGKPLVTAEIVKVAAECAPVESPNDRKKKGGTEVVLACTAWATYEIPDPAAFEREFYANPTASVRFEAVSPKGVVLGSGVGSFKFVRGGNTGTVSAKIVGLSSKEAALIRSVQAGWEY